MPARLQRGSSKDVLRASANWARRRAGQPLSRPRTYRDLDNIPDDMA